MTRRHTNTTPGEADMAIAGTAVDEKPRDLDAETAERVADEQQIKLNDKALAEADRNAKRIEDHFKGCGQPVHYYDFRLIPDANHSMGPGPYAAIVTRILDDQRTADLKIIAPKLPIHDQESVPYRKDLPEDPKAEQAEAIAPRDVPYEGPPLRFWTLPG